jgi:hypothetical protein
MATESKLKSNCKKWYQLNYNNYVLLPEQYIKTGDPDMIICHKGLFVGIEFKLEYNKPTKLQEFKLDFIKKSGGKSFVCFSLKEFQEIIRGLDGQQI